MPSTTVTAFVLAAVALSAQAKQSCASTRPKQAKADRGAVSWNNLPHQWEQGQTGYNGTCSTLHGRS